MSENDITSCLVDDIPTKREEIKSLVNEIYNKITYKCNDVITQQRLMRVDEDKVCPYYNYGKCNYDM